MRADAPRLEELQRMMVQAVHGNAGAFGATAAWIEAAGIDAEKRLFIHHNTINHAVSAVLRQAYPATARALGDACFETLAKDYLHRHPPQRPVLSAYGEGFADFLAAAEAPAPEIAPLARLDWAAQEAYFAGDAAPLTGDRLAGLSAEAHAALRLRLVPSARLLRLECDAVWARWTGLLSGGEIAVSGPLGPAVAALVWRRPDLRVAARGLDVGACALLEALASGRTLVEAAASTAEDHDLDLSGLLAFCLGAGVFRDLDGDIA